ncbi:uncharacterized protein LOC106160123 [Lingula anatina]|uniref:RING-type E3 ubiquitin transferase n=1 Tax=Lingula anatina TaxID=7574 RepID=A0A1S3I410_LINAN|nr:uncharacterized protein LOC106160123 [Lingula anatina]|eukprot:XP_013392094.1 uncharacterized protein LOC106160123 [Lingula anatina]
MSVLNSEYPDPSDWPEDFEEVKGLETLLRCPICFDYLNTAMIIPECSHNYCSLCIRRFINYKTQCPTCSTPVSERELKNNRLLDDIVKKFLAARSRLLQAARSLKPCANDDQVQSPSTSQVASSGMLPGSIKSQLPVVKHCPVPKGEKSEVKDWTKSKMSNVKNKEDKSTKGKSKHSVSRTLHSFYNSPGKSKVAPPMEDLGDSDVIICDSENESMEVTEDKVTTRRDKLEYHSPENPDTPINKTPGSSKPDKGADFLALSSATGGTTSTPERKPEDTVDCPVCGVAIKQRNINLHLDQCLNRSEKKEALRSSKPQKRKPMAKLVYNLMSDKDIRKKLKDIGLPSQGDRQTLIKRHHEFTMLYNSQCDSLNPKSAQEIIKDMERHERTKSKLALTASTQTRLAFEKGDSAENVEKAQKEYVKKHKSQFDDLIAKAKANMKKKKAEKEASSASRTVTTSSVPEGTSSTITSNDTLGVDSLTSMTSMTSVTLMTSVTSMTSATSITTATPATSDSLSYGHQYSDKDVKGTKISIVKGINKTKDSDLSTDATVTKTKSLLAQEENENVLQIGKVDDFDSSRTSNILDGSITPPLIDSDPEEEIDGDEDRTLGFDPNVSVNSNRVSGGENPSAPLATGVVDPNAPLAIGGVDPTGSCLSNPSPAASSTDDLIDNIVNSPPVTNVDYIDMLVNGTVDVGEVDNSIDNMSRSVFHGEGSPVFENTKQSGARGGVRDSLDSSPIFEGNNAIKFIKNADGKGNVETSASELIGAKSNVENENFESSSGVFERNFVSETNLGQNQDFQLRTERRNKDVKDAHPDNDMNINSHDVHQKDEEFGNFNLLDSSPFFQSLGGSDNNSNTLKNTVREDKQERNMDDISLSGTSDNSNQSESLLPSSYIQSAQPEQDLWASQGSRSSTGSRSSAGSRSTNRSKTSVEVDSTFQSAVTEETVRRSKRGRKRSVDTPPDSAKSTGRRGKRKQPTVPELSPEPNQTRKLRKRTN